MWTVCESKRLNGNEMPQTKIGSLLTVHFGPDSYRLSVGHELNRLVQNTSALNRLYDYEVRVQ